MLAVNNNQKSIAHALAPQENIPQIFSANKELESSATVHQIQQAVRMWKREREDVEGNVKELQGDGKRGEDISGK